MWGFVGTAPASSRNLKVLSKQAGMLAVAESDYKDAGRVSPVGLAHSQNQIIGQLAFAIDGYVRFWPLRTHWLH